MSDSNQYIDDIDDKLSFGKHKGQTFGAVLDNSPSYLDWCAGEEAIEFSNEMLDMISDAMARAKPRWRRRNDA